MLLCARVVRGDVRAVGTLGIFGHPDPEYAGHAYFHPSVEGVTALTAFLALFLAALLVLRVLAAAHRAVARSRLGLVGPADGGAVEAMAVTEPQRPCLYQPQCLPLSLRMYARDRP